MNKESRTSKDFVEERREKILNYIKDNGRADVTELAKLTQVADGTIRRDLMTLEQLELVHRTHGGAIAFDKPALWQSTSLHERMHECEEQKNRIATCAQELIHDGDSIMIDGGSTTLAVAKQLSNKKRLLVITNASSIGDFLIDATRTRVLLTGGELLHGTHSMVGPLTEERIIQHRVDKAIIGVSGILLEEGFFAAMPQETEIKRLMISSALKAIVVADSSKIGTRALSLITTFNRKITLITDNGITRIARSSLEASGVEVIVV